MTSFHVPRLVSSFPRLYFIFLNAHDFIQLRSNVQSASCNTGPAIVLPFATLGSLVAGPPSIRLLGLATLASKRRKRNGTLSFERNAGDLPRILLLVRIPFIPHL
jgi:hypothetical protein